MIISNTYINGYHRSRTSQNRQCNDQQKRDKKTNKSRQNAIHKIKNMKTC